MNNPDFLHDPEVPKGSPHGPLEITSFHPYEAAVVDRRRSPTGASLHHPVQTNFRVAVVLFLATCFSVFLAGLSPGGGMLSVPERFEQARKLGVPTDIIWPQMLRDGLTFFAGVMSILVAHEMGHY